MRKSYCNYVHGHRGEHSHHTAPASGAIKENKLYWTLPSQRPGGPVGTQK